MTRKWKIVAGVVAALAVGFGLFVKYHEDERVERNAQSAISWAQGPGSYSRGALDLQFQIRDIEKIQDELSGTWFVGNKSELRSQLSEQHTRLSRLLAQEMDRVRGGR